MDGTTPAAGARTLDGLIGALDRLAEQTETLATDVRADAAQRRVEDARRQRMVVVMLGVAVILMVLVAAVLVIGFQNQQITRQNNAISKRVQDCTTDGGVCQQEGARRTADAIDELERRYTGRTLEVLVHLRRCERTTGVDTDAELVACVRARMAGPSPAR